MPAREATAGKVLIAGPTLLHPLRPVRGTDRRSVAAAIESVIRA